jgi:hypothetical protein
MIIFTIFFLDREHLVPDGKESIHTGLISKKYSGSVSCIKANGLPITDRK